MSLHLILFLVFGAVCVGGAVNLLAQRHPINSALSLIAVMAALAGASFLFAPHLGVAALTLFGLSFLARDAIGALTAMTSNSLPALKVRGLSPLTTPVRIWLQSIGQP